MTNRCNVCNAYCDGWERFVTPQGNFSIGICGKEDCRKVVLVHLHKALLSDKFRQFKEYYKVIEAQPFAANLE